LALTYFLKDKTEAAQQSSDVGTGLAPALIAFPILLTPALLMPALLDISDIRVIITAISMIVKWRLMWKGRDKRAGASPALVYSRNIG
jgi:hypothetical protein